MTADDPARARKRGEHDTERRRIAQQRRAAKEALEREARLARYRRQRIRRRFAFALFAVAAAVAVSHVLEHADAFRVMSPGMQDLFLGYPTAGLLAIAGGMLLGADPGT